MSAVFVFLCVGLGCVFFQLVKTAVLDDGRPPRVVVSAKLVGQKL